MLLTATAASLAPTSTSITCLDNFTVGVETFCAVTVSGSYPIGNIAFTTSSPGGTFNTTGCSNATAYVWGKECYFGYTGTVAGTQTITATYKGDPNNTESSGSYTVIVNLKSSTNNSGSYNILPNSILWDQQEMMQFEGPNYTTLAVMVDAVNQIDISGTGPGYLINGATAGAWYQAGLGYNWGGPGGGFQFITALVNVTNTTTPYIVNVTDLNGPVNNNDELKISMQIVNNFVVMSIIDQNTGASAKVSYPALGASDFITNSPNYYTGLLTEWWYHLNASPQTYIPLKNVTYTLITVPKNYTLYNARFQFLSPIPKTTYNVTKQIETYTGSKLIVGTAGLNETAYLRIYVNATPGQSLGGVSAGVPFQVYGNSPSFLVKAEVGQNTAIGNGCIVRIPTFGNDENKNNVTMVGYVTCNNKFINMYPLMEALNLTNPQKNVTATWVGEAGEFVAFVGVCLPNNACYGSTSNNSSSNYTTTIPQQVSSNLISQIINAIVKAITNFFKLL